MVGTFKYIEKHPNLEKELQTFRSEVVLSVGQIVSCLFWPLTPYNLSGAGSSSAREAQDVWIKIFQDYNIVQKFWITTL